MSNGPQNPDNPGGIPYGFVTSFEPCNRCKKRFLSLRHERDEDNRPTLCFDCYQSVLYDRIQEEISVEQLLAQLIASKVKK